jgi:acyl-CoA synthetase (AMP-forming)/AMP-acid ligase II
MSGYWRNPEATAEALVDGWLRTGDLGSVDATACLTLAGRQGEMFIRGGYNVFPSEVSGVLAGHPGVADVVVIPKPDDVLGEVGVAVVVPARTDDPPTLDDLRDHARGSLAHHKLPEGLLLVDEIPLTAMQKVDRRRLSALVQAPPETI